MKTIYFILLFSFALPAITSAQWDSNPSSIGTALHRLMSQNDYIDKMCISDGNNGSIVISDYQGYNGTGSYTDRTYAQRINADGVLQWGTAENPRLIDEDFYVNSVIPDGAGGAYIAGEKTDAGGNDNVYIQHINSSGNITWATGGIKLSNSNTSFITDAINGDDEIYDESESPRLCSDGTGGVIVTWERKIYYSNVDEDFPTYWQGFAQRLSSTGTVLWGANGVQLSTATGLRGLPEIVTDAAGGAIIFYLDTRNSDYLPGEDYAYPNIDIYAQRISAAGTRMWTDAGVSVCTEPNNQFMENVYGSYHYAVSDGAGGGIIVFEDYRNDNDSPSNLYAQRINSAGVKQWAASGVVVCNSSDYQYSPKVVSNGAQGIVVLWEDERNSSNDRLYTQQINSLGNAVWTINGILLNGTNTDAHEGDVVPDGNGNYVYSWESEYEIKAQSLSNNGTKLWATAGVDVSTATSVSNPNVVMSNNGAAIITYNYEGLYDPGANTRTLGVYAKKLESNGVLPLTLLDFTAISAQARVLLKWSTAIEQNTKLFELERSADNLKFKNIGKVNAAGNSFSNRVYDFTDNSPVYGNNYYRLKQVDQDGAFTYSPIRKVIFGKNNSVVLLSNPVKGEALLKYTSIEKNKLQIRVVDQLGRLVLTKQVMVENGDNQVRLETNGLAKGIYEIVLITSSGNTHVRMMKQ